MNIIFSLLSGLLGSIFSFTGDWGLAIVLLTICVRVLLSPLSFKQRKSMLQQQKLSVKIQKIKEKYKNNKEKLNEEIKKHSVESAKSMKGCLVTLLQLPILMTLWSVINTMPVQVGTFLIPWVSSIKTTDNYFIIPLIYMFISLAPSLLSYITFFKIEGQVIANKSNITIMAVISLMIVKAAPIAVGIYLITTGIFTFLEDIAFRVYIKSIRTA